MASDAARLIWRNQSGDAFIPVFSMVTPMDWSLWIKKYILYFSKLILRTGWPILLCQLGTLNFIYWCSFTVSSTGSICLLSGVRERSQKHCTCWNISLSKVMDYHCWEKCIHVYLILLWTTVPFLCLFSTTSVLVWSIYFWNLTRVESWLPLHHLDIGYIRPYMGIHKHIFVLKIYFIIFQLKD